MDDLYLDNWIRNKIGLAIDFSLTRNAIEAYQFTALKNTLLYAKLNSTYYKTLYKEIDIEDEIKSLRDISKLPLIDEETLINYGPQMSCVSASQISRIVTLETSGSTGEPKRVFFTQEDQELMVDFVHHGIAPIAGEGDLFLILMPCERPGSVGDLVRIGLERRGARTIPYGILPFDGSKDKEILQIMRDNGVDSLLATSSAIYRLAAAMTEFPPFEIKSILLSGEYVTDEIVAATKAAWNCSVFEHYGMTESGLGGAVACNEHIGYHAREADLLFEIIDPITGEVLPDGENGEIVFTTLSRAAMPFIRYRTGDFASIINEPCPCKSIIKRLSRVGSRKAVKGY